MATPSPSPRAPEPDRLVELALDGASWRIVIERLGTALGRKVRYVSVHGTPMSDGVLTSRPAADPLSVVGSDPALTGVPNEAVDRTFAAPAPVRVRAHDGLEMVAIPVRAGTRRVGALCIEAPIDPDDPHVKAAVLALAVESVRRDGQADALAETASRLVDEVRYGSLRPADQLVRAGRRFGVSLDAPHAAAVFAYRGPNRRAWASAVQWFETPVRRDGDTAWTILAASAGIPSELHRIRSRLVRIAGAGDVFAASGPVAATLADTAESFREAEIVLALLRNRGGRELPFEQVGPASLLLAVPPARLEEFVTAHLGPLLDRPDLLETLTAWYATNGSRHGVAERLGIHRNSVGYRVSRIRALLGVDPLEPTVRAGIQTALDARLVLVARADIAPG